MCSGFSLCAFGPSLLGPLWSLTRSDQPYSMTRRHSCCPSSWGVNMWCLVFVHVLLGPLLMEENCCCWWGEGTIFIANSETLLNDSSAVVDRLDSAVDVLAWVIGSCGFIDSESSSLCAFPHHHHHHQDHQYDPHVSVQSKKGKQKKYEIYSLCLANSISFARFVCFNSYLLVCLLQVALWLFGLDVSMSQDRPTDRTERVIANYGYYYYWFQVPTDQWLMTWRTNDSIGPEFLLLPSQSCTNNTTGNICSVLPVHPFIHSLILHY